MTPRMDAVALDDVIVRQSRLLGADRYAAVVAEGRQLERELAAALAAKQEEYQRGFNDGAAIREQELVALRAQAFDSYNEQKARLAAAERDNAALRADAEQHIALLRQCHVLTRIAGEARLEKLLDAAIDAASRQGKPNAD